MKTILKHNFNFGKINYHGTRKENTVIISLELRERGGEKTFIIDPITKKEKPTGNTTPVYVELSICGKVWNRTKTDILTGGQCLDDIVTAAPYLMRNPTFKRLFEIWELYHLNDMHAGTPDQESKIKEWENAGNIYEFSAVCDMLKECGLYEMNYTGISIGKVYNNELYRYGSAWLVETIPTEIIEELTDLVNREGR